MRTKKEEKKKRRRRNCGFLSSIPSHPIHPLLHFSLASKLSQLFFFFLLSFFVHFTSQQQQQACLGLITTTIYNSFTNSEKLLKWRAELITIRSRITSHICTRLTISSWRWGQSTSSRTSCSCRSNNNDNNNKRKKNHHPPPPTVNANSPTTAPLHPSVSNQEPPTPWIQIWMTRSRRTSRSTIITVI